MEYLPNMDKVLGSSPDVLHITENKEKDLGEYSQWCMLNMCKALGWIANTEEGGREEGGEKGSKADMFACRFTVVLQDPAMASLIEA